MEIATRGVLSVEVDDVSGDAVDIDLHLLREADPATCLTRDNVALEWLVEPGRYTLVADTWVNSAGEEQAGPYTLTARWRPLTTMAGRCAVEERDLEMFWSGCAPGIACREEEGRVWLQTPALGPVVREAHLVTVDEAFEQEWPTTSRDQIDRHYQLSEEATGYVMARGESWAPAGEGGSRFGQGSTGAPLPVVDEAWYVNMYWRARPARGTRMIVLNPRSGRAVVAAAGYETGPGANTAIGGASEEIHHALGTEHRDALIMGFAVDQELPLGPITCP